MKPLPSVERIRQLCTYDADTGVFRWRITRRQAKAGQIATHKRGSLPYLFLDFDYGSYRAHRVAFKMMTGREPPAEIDHINGDAADNRWANLREATREENNRNARRRRDNKSGFKGVYWNSRDLRWMASVRRGGKQRYLGSFTTPEEAHAAYASAARENYGEFARLD